MTCLSVVLGLAAFVASSRLEPSVGKPQGHEGNAQERSIYKRSIGPLDGDYFPSGDNNYAAKRQAGYNAWRKGKRSHSGYDSLAQPASLPSSYGSMEPNHLFDLLALNALREVDQDQDQESPQSSMFSSRASFAPSMQLNKRTPYSQWRKNGKREYRDWRKGKRDHEALNEIMPEDLYMNNPQRRSEMGFKQWRKMG